VATITIANVNGWPTDFRNALKRHKIGGCMQLNSDGKAEFIIDDNDAGKALDIWQKEIAKR
jgi:hypothetical protein